MNNTNKLKQFRGCKSFHTSNHCSLDSQAYVDFQYQAWKKDPSSVHESWHKVFANKKPQTSISYTEEGQQIDAHKTTVEVQNILYAYRTYGHFHANIDPLGVPRRQRSELELTRFDFDEKDLDKPIRLGPLARPGEAFDDQYTLADLLSNLKASYCSSIGVEYMHITDVEQCDWIRSRVEKNVFTASLDDNDVYTPSTNEEKLHILDQLIISTQFEEYLQSKFNDKRFGCDGAESVIGGINKLIEQSAALGVKDIVIGMAHRGRINVLANIMGKPVQNIFREFFHGTLAQQNASGDVKYHLGVSCNRETSNGNIHLSLVANPSHLEAVNPVVEGKVRAKQETTHNNDKSKALSLLIHGDGSFAGQGIVAETITMSGLPKYSTGGTIHVIINNQISFTTNPRDARPDSDYCTGVAIPNGAPILHVNGDDPQAVNWAFALAAEWRQKFFKDFVIDVVCYRRFGHNEGDQPFFTQPLMYKKIASMPKTLEIYSQKLIGEGVLTQSGFEERKAANLAVLEKEYAEAKATDKFETNEEFYQDISSWKGFLKLDEQLKSVRYSSISPESFDAIGKAFYTLPKGFTVHPTIDKMLKGKQQMIESGKGIDWATAEALAFGSLLAEGTPVRLSGQDVERGTFSHRHAVLHDQIKDIEYKPLDFVPGKQASFSVTNSFLSEYAALGYEYGYALEFPKALVIWEAQFGDFVNGAQIIIDQFLSGCEQKWQRQNGLVMLLPHGMEGQGPEHSSGRLERFLQLSDQNSDVFSLLSVKQVKESNIQVCNITMPANYFHALRRQVLREFRKPLIIMSPKSLLRHPEARSERKDFDGPQLKFIRVYGETNPNISNNADNVKRLIFCSGKVYFDLLDSRTSNKREDIAIIRIEQLSPFPFDDVESECQKYKNAEIVWCQEEHKNHGAWHFIYFNFLTVLKHSNDSRTLSYIGRSTKASPATGAGRVHKTELANFVNEAIVNSSRE